MTTAAPPPDRSHVPLYANGLVAEIVYGEDGQSRAVITRDDEGIFRIYHQWWDLDYWEQCGLAQWSSAGCSSLTDSIDHARSLAVEQLR